MKQRKNNYLVYNHKQSQTINAEETLEEHENSEPKENANASDTDDADNSSNTAINKATDFS